MFTQTQGLCPVGTFLPQTKVTLASAASHSLSHGKWREAKSSEEEETNSSAQMQWMLSCHTCKRKHFHQSAGCAASSGSCVGLFIWLTHLTLINEWDRKCNPPPPPPPPVPDGYHKITVYNVMIKTANSGSKSPTFYACQEESVCCFLWYRFSTNHHAGNYIIQSKIID